LLLFVPERLRGRLLRRVTAGRTGRRLSLRLPARRLSALLLAAAWLSAPWLPTLGLTTSWLSILSALITVVIWLLRHHQLHVRVGT
jgi:uncharacterized membrane protein YphA (DoxX/SURF4 family)